MSIFSNIHISSTIGLLHTYLHPCLYSCLNPSHINKLHSHSHSFPNHVIFIFIFMFIFISIYHSTNITVKSFFSNCHFFAVIGFYTIFVSVLNFLGLRFICIKRLKSNTDNTMREKLVLMFKNGAFLACKMVLHMTHTKFDKNIKSLAKEQRYVLHIWESNAQFLYNIVVVEKIACHYNVALVIS